MAPPFLSQEWKSQDGKRYAFTDEQVSRMLTFINSASQKQLWTMPRMKLTQLPPLSDLPEYIPLSRHIVKNTEDTTSGNLDQRALPETFQCPQECFSLAKAAALLPHGMTRENFMFCMPQGGRSEEWASKFLHIEVHKYCHAIKKEDGRARSSMTVRLIHVGFYLLRTKLQEAGWILQIAAMTDEQIINEFEKMLSVDHIAYVYAEGWDAVSFDIIWHDAKRTDAEEENIRMKLRRCTKLGAAVMIWHILVDVVMEVNAEEEGLASTFKVGELTPEVVKCHLKKGKRLVMSRWEQLSAEMGSEKLDVNIFELPAREGFGEERPKKVKKEAKKREGTEDDEGEVGTAAIKREKTEEDGTVAIKTEETADHGGEAGMAAIKREKIEDDDVEDETVARKRKRTIDDGGADERAAKKRKISGDDEGGILWR